jgi:CheY-like chemotaxis protein
MKKLLIHAQETVIADSNFFPVDEQYVFTTDTNQTDVDHHINEILSKGELFEKIMRSNIVYIRLSLTANYLEYTGLRMAYHIRLTTKLQDKRFIPIVIVCEESYQFIGVTSNIPEILFTTGLYLMEDSKTELEKNLKMFKDGKIKLLSDEKSFLEKIHIPPPANYTSRHSLANEWGILRWAEMGKNFTDELRVQLNGINTSNRTLYFKFLEQKHLFAIGKEMRQGFKKDDKRETLVIHYQPGAKVYYIDDEAKKGWGVLFKDGILKDYTVNSAFDYYQDFEKGADQNAQANKLEAALEELIEKEKYNVFIVDLRLFDADFKMGAIPSGFRIIEKIRDMNPGVQVVVFTASKNAENMQKAHDLKVAGYVIKESPDNVLTRQESWNQFMTFSRAVQVAAQYSHLAEVFTKLRNIRNTIPYASSTVGKEKEFYLAATAKGGFLDKIFNFLSKRDSDLIGSAFLEGFVMLEKFANLFYVEKQREMDGCVIQGNGTEFYHFNFSPPTTYSTSIEFKKGNFPYQLIKDGKTPIGATFNQAKVHKSNRVSGCGTRGLVRLLAVLKYRFIVTDDKLEKIMEASYLRSNLAAHDTGEIDKSNRIIEVEDLDLVLDICSDVFSMV